MEDASISQIRFWIAVANGSLVKLWLQRATLAADWPQRVLFMDRVESSYIAVYQTAVDRSVRNKHCQPWETASRLSTSLTPTARDDIVYFGMPNELVDRTAIYSTVAEALYAYVDWLKNADPAAHAEFITQMNQIRPKLQEASRVLMKSRLHKAEDLGTLSGLPEIVRESICRHL